ncbi:phosphoglycerate dehydrogenase [Candidatus Woesearchaeota archaeon]|nr:phosphoglycerate dehydrogenase [Candidatus Woesearchaeota archaeon]
MKVLIADKIHEKGIEFLKKNNIEADVKTGLSPEELNSIIGNYHGLIVRSKTQANKELLDNAENLKIIGRAGTGVDNIDIPYATEKGIFVANTPFGNTISAAEHTMAMLLALSRHIPMADNSLKNRQWEKKKFTGNELYGKTIGVIGLGKIGLNVAKRCTAFDMDVIAYDPYVSREITDKFNIRLVELEYLIKNSDFITVHIPLNDKTKDLISEKEFDMMKPNARIINVARGGIINEDALYNALKQGKIAGAAIDVFTSEPAVDNKLIELDNIVVTPHLGASTEEAQEKVALMIAETITAVLNNMSFNNVLNLPIAEIEIPEKIRSYLELAEKIGVLHCQLIKGNINEIEIQTTGELNEFSKIITLYSLLGLFKNTSDYNVNLVNVQNIAKEKGLKIIQSQSQAMVNFKNSITIRIKNTDKEQEIKGTVFGAKYLRIIKINEFRLDFYPEKILLLIKYKDGPGVIGQVGTILGKEEINIDEFRSGRSKNKETALAAVNVNSELTNKVLEKIKNIKEVTSVKQIVF